MLPAVNGNLSPRAQGGHHLIHCDPLFPSPRENLKDYAKPKVHHVFINQIAATMCTCKTMTSMMPGLFMDSPNVLGCSSLTGPPGSLDVSYVHMENEPPGCSRRVGRVQVSGNLRIGIADFSRFPLTSPVDVLGCVIPPSEQTNS